MPNCSELLRHVALGMAKAHVWTLRLWSFWKPGDFIPKVSSFGTGKLKEHVASLGMQHLNRYINAFHFSKCTVLFCRSASEAYMWYWNLNFAQHWKVEQALPWGALSPGSGCPARTSPSCAGGVSLTMGWLMGPVVNTERSRFSLCPFLSLFFPILCHSSLTILADGDETEFCFSSEYKLSQCTCVNAVQLFDDLTVKDQEDI